MFLSNNEIFQIWFINCKQMTPKHAKYIKPSGKYLATADSV